MSKLTSLGTQPLLGALISLSAALSIGITPVLFKYAYEDGAGAIFVILLHGLVPVIFLYLFAILCKKPLALREIPRKAIILACLSLNLTAFGSVYAITFISPSLMIIILYTFPILVLLTTAFLTKKAPSLLLTVFYISTFLGLALAIGPEFQTINLWGVLLAFLAAIGSAMFYFVGHVAGDKIGTHRLVFIGSVSLTIISLILLIASDGYSPPASHFGWGLLLIGAFCYMLGIILIFLSATYLRPDLASLIMNIEPFVTITTAFLLLGDRLSVIQMLGVCVVIASITLSGIIAHRQHLDDV